MYTSTIREVLDYFKELKQHDMNKTSAEKVLYITCPSQTLFKTGHIKDVIKSFTEEAFCLMITL